MFQAVTSHPAEAEQAKPVNRSICIIRDMLLAEMCEYRAMYVGAKPWKKVIRRGEKEEPIIVRDIIIVKIFWRGLVSSLHVAKYNELVPCYARKIIVKRVGHEEIYSTWLLHDIVTVSPLFSSFLFKYYFQYIFKYICRIIKHFYQPSEYSPHDSLLFSLFYKSYEFYMILLRCSLFFAI